jgi:hypothetical protein
MYIEEKKIISNSSYKFFSHSLKTFNKYCSSDVVDIEEFLEYLDLNNI